MRNIVTALGVFFVLVSGTHAEIPISQSDLAAIVRQIYGYWRLDIAAARQCPTPFTVHVPLEPNGKAKKVELVGELANEHCKRVFESFSQAVLVSQRFVIPAGVTLESLDFDINPSDLVR